MDKGFYGSKSLSAAGLALAAALFGAGPGHASESPVEWRQGLLSVRGAGQTLAAVLQEIGATTGMTVLGADAQRQPLAVRVERQPLADALRLLLADRSYVLIEAPQVARWRLIMVGGDLRAAAPAAPRVAANSEGPSVERALRSADSADRVEAVERLAGRRDSHSVSLLRQAATDPSDAVRAVAQEALAQVEGRSR